MKEYITKKIERCIQVMRRDDIDWKQMRSLKQYYSELVGNYLTEQPYISKNHIEPRFSYPGSCLECGSNLTELKTDLLEPIWVCLVCRKKHTQFMFDVSKIKKDKVNMTKYSMVHDLKTMKKIFRKKVLIFFEILQQLNNNEISLSSLKKILRDDKSNGKN